MGDFIEVETKSGIVNLRFDSVCLIENEKNGWTPVLLDTGKQLMLAHKSRTRLETRLRITKKSPGASRKRMSAQQLKDQSEPR